MRGVWFELKFVSAGAQAVAIALRSRLALNLMREQLGRLIWGPMFEDPRLSIMPVGCDLCGRIFAYISDCQPYQPQSRPTQVVFKISILHMRQFGGEADILGVDCAIDVISTRVQCPENGYGPILRSTAGLP